MRRLVFLSLLCALASCATPATPASQPKNQPTSQPVNQRSTTSDRDALVAKIEQFNRSIREGDKRDYADVFVDDFVFTWSRNGQIYDREAILPNVLPTPAHDPLVDELIVRTYRDSAIVNFRSRKNPEDSGVRVTFAYTRTDGGWKVMSSHSTKIVVEDDDPAE